MDPFLPPPDLTPTTGPGPAAGASGADDRSSHDLASNLQQTLVDAARAVLDAVSGSDGVGVTVQLPDGPAYCGANPYTAEVDQVQYSLMEGPCVTAADSGQLVRFRARDARDHRWPRFRTEVVPLSLRDVVSVPLLAGAQVIGSLNVYSRRDDRLGSLDEAQARRLAARAQPAVWASRTLHVAATNARLLRQAGQDHVDVERGVAWLMRYYAVDPDRARILLGQVSRDSGVDEASAARELLAEDERSSRSS